MTAFRIAGLQAAAALLGIIATPGTPLDCQTTATVREELRIGAVNDPGPLAFHRINSVAVGADGQIYVANGSSTTIRAFAPDGKFLREFGRRGSGPGEFIAINVIWLTGDTVVAVDWQGGGSVALFNNRGELIDSWKSLLADGSRLNVIGNSPRGWLAWVSPPARARRFAPGEVMRDSSYLHVLEHKTRAVGPLVRAQQSATRLVGGSGESGRDWPLFEPRLGGYSSGTGTQYFVPDPVKYAIDVFDNTGRRVRTITHPFTPHRITSADVDEVRSMTEEHYRQRPPSPGFQSVASVLARINARAQMPMVENMTPFGTMIASLEGELWVERPDLVKSPARVEYERSYPVINRVLKLPEPASKWDRFDNAGRFIGQITLPANFTAFALSNGKVYGVSRDDNDVEFVVRLRVEASQ